MWVWSCSSPRVDARDPEFAGAKSRLDEGQPAVNRAADGTCAAGTVAVGSACVSDTGPCAFLDCSGHGACAIDERGLPTCQCDPGYRLTALECVPERRDCMVHSAEQFRSFPTKNAQTPGGVVESECVRVTGIASPLPLEVAYDRGEVSVNGGPWSKKITLRDNDVVRWRGQTHDAADSGNTLHLVAGDDIYGSFEHRTANADRAPETFRVGPQRKYRQLSELSEILRAGDVVELDGGATYGAVEFKRAGTPAQPIWIRGVSVNGKRPVIAGGNVTLSFRRAHDYVVENVEVTGGRDVCVRVEADGIRLMNVFVHDCERHGVLGTDNGSGTLVLDRVEVTRSGAERPKEALKHGVYVASDYQTYPGSKLKVIHSYLHGNGGNAMKSRAERTEVYFNWLESGTVEGAYYALELIGLQEYPEHGPQNSDVVGNVFIHRSRNGLRLGGDGSGESRGRVRLVNNTFVAPASYTPDGDPMLRASFGLDAIWLSNNLFYRVGGETPGLRIWRHDQAEWVTGRPQAAGFANWVPEGGTFTEEYFPPNLKGTLRGVGNPGLRAVDDLEVLDLGLTESSALVAAGSTTGPDAGFVVETPLAELWSAPPARRPPSGVPLRPVLRKATEVNVGAL